MHHGCIIRVSCVYHTWILVQYICTEGALQVHHTCIMCVSHVNHSSVHMHHGYITSASYVYHMCIIRKSRCITRESHIYVPLVYHMCTSHASVKAYGRQPESGEPLYVLRCVSLLDSLDSVMLLFWPWIYYIYSIIMVKNRNVNIVHSTYRYSILMVIYKKHRALSPIIKDNSPIGL